MSNIANIIVKCFVSRK